MESERTKGKNKKNEPKTKKKEREKKRKKNTKNLSTKTVCCMRDDVSLKLDLFRAAHISLRVFFSFVFPMLPVHSHSLLLLVFFLSLSSSSGSFAASHTLFVLFALANFCNLIRLKRIKGYLIYINAENPKKILKRPH